MDAVALGARVQQVAEKLQQKAQEAREKGNGGAAQALADSVSDLRQAAAVLVEQKRLLTVHQSSAAGSSLPEAALRPRLRRNSSASSLVSLQSTFDSASVAGSVHHHHHHASTPHGELLTRLARVETMLAKKSDEVRRKGNESAGNALQQSAACVRASSALVSDQHQQLQALTGRVEQHERLSRALRTALTLPDTDGDDDNSDDAVLARVTALVNERDALRHQVAETKKEHAQEYLILREDVAILQNDKRDLERTIRDVERVYTERSERDLATLQAANDKLESAALATATYVVELQHEAEVWKDQFHDEQRKLSELLSTATATTAETAALRRLQDEHLALQALLRDSDERFKSERATLERDVETLTTRLADAEREGATLINELTHAVDGYRDKSSKAQTAAQEADRRSQQLDKVQERASAFLSDCEALFAAYTETPTDVSSERFDRVKALVVTTLATTTATADVQRQLDDTVREFERYRARSHAALKKVEKRAELLNGMRKENAELRQQCSASEDARQRAEERGRQLTDALREATETQCMLAAEREQRVAEAYDALAASDATRRQLAVESEQVARQLRDATSQLETATQENGALVAVTEQLREELAAVREAERVQRQSTEAKLTALTDEMEKLRAESETQRRVDEECVASLEQEIETLTSRLRDTTVATVAPAAEAAKEQTIRALRMQVLELQDQLQVYDDEKAARAFATERDELSQVQAARAALQRASEHAINAKQRDALVQTFQERLHTVVDELQRGLDDHATAFRDACAFRDVLKQQRQATATEPHDDDSESVGIVAGPDDDDDVDDASLFEECRAIKSGVVIKAGAGFALPIVCEAAGWRVTWSFAVKEESADVGFTLVLVDGTQQRQDAVVAPERVHALSGTFVITASTAGATLRFEWDNAFSWLNEKTLDYHVSVQAPLSPAKSQRHGHTRSLQRTVTRLRDGLVLLRAESVARAQLQAAVTHLHAAADEKDAYVRQFNAQTHAVVARKSALQLQMEELKATLSRLLSEQDELDDAGRTLLRVWSNAAAECEDAETTVRLADASQLTALAQELEERVQVLEQELRAVQDDEPSALVAA